MTQGALLAARRALVSATVATGAVATCLLPAFSSRRDRSIPSGALLASASVRCPWARSHASIATRVAQVMARITEEQELTLLVGQPSGYVGSLPGIPALCVPALYLEDGPQGVADGTAGATQLPAPVAAAATWDTASERRYGQVVGAEGAADGVSVNLGPTINIVRDPRWGRSYESFGEDPFLNGQMAAAYIKGVQSEGVTSEVKHYAVYNVETFRNTPQDDDVVSQRAEQEIYLPAFQASVEAGAGAVMCAYSQPNGVPACQNQYLLGVLDRQFGFQGFVTSDWGATQSTVASAEAGEDVDMPGYAAGAGASEEPLFGPALAAAVADHQLPRAYIDDMAERVLTSMFKTGLFGRPQASESARPLSTPAHVATATQVAEEGTVLLKNSDGLLPLSPSSAGSIALIGEPVSSGQGSAYVSAPAVTLTAKAIEAKYHGAIRAYVSSGTDLKTAVVAAKAAKVAVVFVGYEEAEGGDLTNIDLSPASNDLVAAVVKANPHTVVVLSTGSAVTMPWLGKVPAVLEEWYGGQQLLPAIEAILFGQVDPSGRLPVTFPRSLAQVPASKPQEFPGANGKVEYSEGIDVGYRWYQVHRISPLFPFGFGLSYTTFAFSDLHTTGFGSSGTATVEATVTNTGRVAGTEVAQLYIGDPATDGEPPWQLKGFTRTTLMPGASARVSFHVPLHDLTYWGGRDWTAPASNYSVAVGGSSADLSLKGRLVLAHAVGTERVDMVAPARQVTPVGSHVALRIRATATGRGHTVRYAASALPGGLYLDPATGQITGKVLHAGTSRVTVTATDENAVQAKTSFAWDVTTGKARRSAPLSTHHGGLSAAALAALLVVLAGASGLLARHWWSRRRSAT